MKLLPHPVLTVLLAVLWVLMVNDFSLAHLCLGLFLGVLIPLLLKDFLLQLPKVRKPFKLLVFVLKVFFDIVVANLLVAKLVLGHKPNIEPAFVSVPLDVEDEFLLSVLASIVSMTPGTVSAGLSPDHKTLMLHALDAPNDEDVIQEVKTRYEAPLMEIFACSST